MAAKGEDFVDPRELIALEEELITVKEQQGIVEKPRWWVRLGDRITDRLEHSISRKEPIDRRRYIRLALACGWICGAHRFYNRQRYTGLLYLLFCWTGIPLAMTLVDLMIALPKQADDQGMILL